ncbi:hypothetical protein OS493_006327 [Desmophyllum pertusum]|uniref:Uncharacterized protein n=1 Tax=Desmophyllum pertusum TaxID=174260 RepID=A0A9X0DBA8_9CNID|nr:hypothetical protein OS493_006327 [Desmophyllum pertusum]
MDVSQVVLNGEKFLQDRRPVILALSPGNPHYSKREVLERLFDFIARKNSDKVLLFIPDKISEHSYRARTWKTCHEYHKALADIKDLYEANDEFRDDIRESTEAALRSLKNGRGKGGNKENELAEESAVDLNEEAVITPLTGILSTPARFGSVLALIFASTVVQNVGGGALYGFVGKHFPKFGVHAAQSGGVCAFAATFVIRCISKGSFQHLRDRDQGFRLSGYLFVALVDLIILVACCFIAILRAHVGPAYAKRLNFIDRGNAENGEDQPLMMSDEFSDVSRKKVIRNNCAALATICLTLVISNSLFPGITSQFHGNYNCTTPTRNLSDSSGFLSNRAAANYATVSPTRAPSSDKTGWFIVILFGCYSVADAIGKNLPILGIIYNKKSILCNCLVQLVIAIPILLIYFEPCISGLQADWVAYLTVGLLGLVNGYGLCAAMMLLAPGKHGKKHEEGLATSIGYMFLQVGILLGMGVSLLLVDVVFEATTK